MLSYNRLYVNAQYLVFVKNYFTMPKARAIPTNASGAPAPIIPPITPAPIIMRENGRRHFEAHLPEKERLGNPVRDRDELLPLELQGCAFGKHIGDGRDIGDCDDLMF